jgi:Ca2+-binding RTX toxin-like protein
MYEHPDAGEESQGVYSALSGSVRAGGAHARSLENISVVEGTDSADAFYALGSLDGLISPARSFEYAHEGQTYTLTGNVFLGGKGTDVFFGSELDNLFVGGDGWDLANFSLDSIEAEEVTASGVQDLIINLKTGTATERVNSGAGTTSYLDGIEGIVGTRGTDVIIGDDNANFLFGYQGHDTIEGGGGSDYIDLTDLVKAVADGGAGDDIVALGWTEDAQVSGGSGTDTLELKADQGFRLDRFFEEQLSAEYSDPMHLVSGWNVDLSAGTASAEFLPSSARAGDTPFLQSSSVTDFENVLGSELGDNIVGNSANNMLAAREGDDAVDGGAGDDAVDGGVGTDVVHGGAGDDVVSGGDESAGKTIYESGFDGLKAGGFSLASSVDGWKNPNGGTIEHWGAGLQGILAVSEGGAIEIDRSAQAPGSPGDGITQQFDTTVDQLYRFEFRMQARPGYDATDPSQAVVVEINGVPAEHVVIQLGEAQSPVSATPYLSPDNTWQTYVVEFTGTGSDRITLQEATTYLVGGDSVAQIENDGYGAVVSDVRLSSVGEDDDLWGDGGSDIFLLHSKSGADRINDFESGIDKISLEAFGVGYQAVTLNDVGGNTEIVVDGATVGTVMSQSSGDLSESDFLFAPSRIAQEIAATEQSDLLDAGAVAALPGTRFVANGGSGDDTIIGAMGEDELLGGADDDQIKGMAGEDPLFGGAGFDRLEGGEGDDLLNGGSGGDTLVGGAGNDEMTGAGGPDRFEQAGDGHDVITDFVRGEDILAVKGVDFSLPGAPQNPAEFLQEHGVIEGSDLLIVLDSNNSIRLQGLADPSNPGQQPADFAEIVGFADPGPVDPGPVDPGPVDPGPDPVIPGLTGTGGDGADFLLGAEGNDSLYGMDGNDTLNGEAGDDHLSGGENADSINGGDGNDVIRGNHGRDTLIGGKGNDFIGDWAGWSLLDGGEGDDTMLGGAGNDTLIGGDGDDRLTGGEHADSLVGGAGDDMLWGHHGKDTLLGGDGNDHLGDWAGWSMLDGGDGNDVLRAGAGNDTLIGGKGDDTLTGGKHADLFRMDADSGQDVITDFVLGLDSLSLSDIAIGDNEDETSAADFLTENATIENGSDLFLDLGGGRSIRILDVVDEDTGEDVADFEELFLPM